MPKQRNRKIHFNLLAIQVFDESFDIVKARRGVTMRFIVNADWY